MFCEEKTDGMDKWTQKRIRHVWNKSAYAYGLQRHKFKTPIA